MSKHLALDIGCGKYKTPGTIGIDIDPNSGADYVEDVEITKRFQGKCEYVIVSHMLEHANPLRVMQAVYRFLKPNGIVYVQVPNAYNLAIIMRMFQQDWYVADPHHVQAFGIFELTRLLENTGFKPIHHGYCVPRSHFGRDRTLLRMVKSLIVRFKPQFNDALWIVARKV